MGLRWPRWGLKHPHEVRCQDESQMIRMGTEVPLRDSGAQNGDQVALMGLRCLKGVQDPNMGLRWPGWALSHILWNSSVPVGLGRPAQIAWDWGSSSPVISLEAERREAEWARGALAGSRPGCCSLGLCEKWPWSSSVW